MNKQLTFIEIPQDWHIDDRTREIGRWGLAMARAALKQRHLAASYSEASFEGSSSSNYSQAA